MDVSKPLFPPIALFIILILSFPSSSAHDKTQNQQPPPTDCQCQCPPSSPAPLIHNQHSSPPQSPASPTPQNQNQQDPPSHTPGSSAGRTHHKRAPHPHSPPSSDPQTRNQQAHLSNSPVNLHGSFNKVYAFGDSYTDTGNAYLQGAIKGLIGSFIKYLPFGPKATFSQDKGRLCDGRLVIDYICEAFSLPYLPPYMKKSANFSSGANFAIAGSTSLTADFFLNNLIARNLMWQKRPEGFQTQIDWYHKYEKDLGCRGKDESSCKAEMENALFWLGEMGVNDYARTFGTTISTRWLTQSTLDNVCKLAETLLTKGAKYMVVQGLPPMGCLPLCLLLSPPSNHDSLGCASGINSVIMAHNELLQKKVKSFQMQFPGATIVYADYWNAYRAILMNATAKYNFKEPFKACCGAGGGNLNCNLNSLCGASGTTSCDNPSEHMIWDGVHLTEAMHKQLADLFLYQGFCKPSFSELLRKKKQN